VDVGRACRRRWPTQRRAKKKENRATIVATTIVKAEGDMENNNLGDRNPSSDPTPQPDLTHFTGPLLGDQVGSSQLLTSDNFQIFKRSVICSNVCILGLWLCLYRLLPF